jgi:aspartyl/asparaginyl beta-hydroxylase (cupin superfamily)
MLKKPENVLKIKKVNISEIEYFVNSLSNDEWNEWLIRQNTFYHHSQTKSYPLLWSSNEYDSDQITVFKKNFESTVWNFLNPIMDYLSDTYEADVVKCMFVNLPSSCTIDKHKDGGTVLIDSHRIHLPIKTNIDVKFFIDDEQYFFEQGFLYEINNQKYHSVENLSEYDRIHLIIDLLPYHKNIKVTYVNE